MDPDRNCLSWTSSDSHVLINPRLEAKALAQSKKILASAPNLPAHLWIQSSGSTSSAEESAKWIALSKQAFLASAEAVNLHLQSDSQDKWGLSLPTFHVGGVSILARAYLSKASITKWEKEWEVLSFHSWLENEKVTLLSLVPTQLFDLVQAQLKSPPSLRAVILGGAALEESLYQKAQALGWPVLPSFGMTEFCSQVATAKLGNPELILLSHVQARLDEEKNLWLKGPSCFTGFLQERAGKIHWETPQLENGFWKTSDRGSIKGNILIPFGRSADYVKIKGEGVNLNDLRSRFENWIAKENKFPLRSFAIVAVPHPREGMQLVLAVENPLDLQKQVEAWNQNCFPIERLQIKKIDQIPRSSLGKVLTNELLQILN